MGIRVHKVLGYGLTNLIKNDPRIDWVKYRKMYELEWYEFFKWLDSPDNIQRVRELCANEKKDASLAPYLFGDTDIGLLKRSFPDPPRGWDPASCFQWDENVFNVIAPDSSSWYRHDDIIDYCEENEIHNTENRWMPVSGGIFPYIGTMIRFRGPKEGVYQKIPKGIKGEILVDEKGYVRLSTGLYNQLIGKWDSKIPPIATGEFLKHLQEDFRPPIPNTIIALLLWAEVFTDLKVTLDELRPILMVYWA
jgi:hypothetical protein